MAAKEKAPNIRPVARDTYWVGLITEKWETDSRRAFHRPRFSAEIIPPIGHDSVEVDFQFPEKTIVNVKNLPHNSVLDEVLPVTRFESAEEFRDRVETGLRALLSPTGLVDVNFYDPTQPEEY